MDLDFNNYPEFREAVEREEFVRNSAFLGLSETVAGFELRPFTFRMWLTLRVAQSPLVVGGVPTAENVAGFLWLCSVDNAKGWITRKRFYHRCRSLKSPIVLRETVLAIRLYYAEAMMDSPPQSAGPAIIQTSYYSDAAWVCGRMAREYGYRVDDVLDMPLKMLWQFLNENKEEHSLKNGKTAVLFNPISDPIRRQIVNRLNEH